MFNLSVPQDDGLIIPTVGEWSKDKHYFLQRYIDAFTTSMKDKKWEGLHYVDLFSGSGMERLEDSNTLEWGSPLIAAQSPHPFTRLHLCEFNKTKYEALSHRILKFRSDSQILYGDANEKVEEILQEIPNKTLSLAFLDPFGLHLEYNTLRQLSRRRMDFIIFFPDHLDAIRNWEHNYFDNPNSNLDRCFGEGSNWRDIIDKTPSNLFAEQLKKLYVTQIQKLGYSQIDYHRITLKNGRPLYLLLFCSQNSLAAKLWRNISQKQPDGQRLLSFE